MSVSSRNRHPLIDSVMRGHLSAGVNGYVHTAILQHCINACGILRLGASIKETKSSLIRQGMLNLHSNLAQTEPLSSRMGQDRRGQAPQYYLHKPSWGWGGGGHPGNMG